MYAVNAGLLRRALDADSAARRRTHCVRGAALNAALLLALAADLSCKCEGYMSALHWVELAAAGVAGANLLRLALALVLPAHKHAAGAPLTADQRRLLGLSVSNSYDDTSLKEEHSFASSPAALSASSVSEEELSLSVSVCGGEWRRSPPAHAATPPSPPLVDDFEQPARDRFIADRSSLADYLREYEERRRSKSPTEMGGVIVGGVGGMGGAGVWGAAAAPAYQLAAADEPARAAHDDSAGAPLDHALAAAWARLHLDPQRLTQFNLNLRVWLHVTILARLVRALDECEAGGVAPGELSAERLRAHARGAHAPPALRQLLPFLEPFHDQRYVVRRIRTLATGGALSEYRWCGGGAGWDESQPTDAELVLHVFSSYLDAQLPAPAPGLRPFSARHLSSAPAAPPPDLAVHRATARPPHYVLVVGGETLDPGAGRNNLLHTLLVLVAACARADPPALHRLHLGPAGLNMLWIIGR